MGKVFYWSCLFILFCIKLFLSTTVLYGQSNIDISSQLIYYWKFDEGIDTVARDASGCHGTGILKGAGWTNHGKFSKALSIEAGTKGYCETKELNIEFKEITISFWIYRIGNNGASGDEGLICRNLYGRPFIIKLTKSGHLRTFLRTTTGSLYVNSGAMLQDNTWNHIVITYRQGERQIYINGLLDKVDTTLKGDLSYDSKKYSIRVGSSDTSNYGMYGYYDEVRIYTRALNAEEVKALYDGTGLDTTPPLPVITVKDGLEDDKDSTISKTTLSANWSEATDQESKITKYYFAIGTTPLGTEILDWTTNNLLRSVTVEDLNLIVGTRYYISVKAENSSGLQSLPASSNGIVVVEPYLPIYNVYVGPTGVDSLFAQIGDSCLNIIRSKRILFSSRSWGLAIKNKYISDLGVEYQLNWSPFYYYGDNGPIPDNAFDEPGVVHYRNDDDLYQRWHYIADVLRGTGDRSVAFGPQVDMVIQFLYGETQSMSMWKGYSKLFDSLRIEYPNVKFVICTHHVSADTFNDWNLYGNPYSDSVLARYLGKTPVYDIRAFASISPTGDTCFFEYNGKRYYKMCDEYATQDKIHMLSYKRLEKGFFVLMQKLFCEECTNVGEININIPLDFKLLQNYPNPFNPRTKIRYKIPKQSRVILNVYDILGREVAKLVDEVKQAGEYEIEYDASSVASGVYFYKLTAGEHLSVKKMVVIK